MVTRVNYVPLAQMVMQPLLSKTRSNEFYYSREVFMKSKKLFILISLFLMFFIQNINADIPQGYKVQKDFFIISTKTPPALLYIVDAHGNRAGINPSFITNLDQYGILKKVNGFLNEIPLSQSEQQNNGDPNNNFSPSPTTPCLITILDGGNQTYTINLVGITEGVQRVTVKDLPLGRPSNPQGTKVYVLIGPNIVKQIKVAVNTDTNTTDISRVVGNGDLLNDVKTACQLNQITSGHVCKHLEDIAEAIQGALDHHHYEEAERLIWVFLHSLGESRTEGCKDDDDHAAIQEPALTILKEDAKALLAQVQKDEKAYHGDHDHAGDNAR